MLFSARGRLASHWLYLAEGRLRLDRLNRNGGGETFFPGLRPFLARQESLPAAIVRCAAAQTGAASIAFVFQIAHRGRGGRGTRKRQGEVTWLTSALSRNPARNSIGEIVTLSLQTKGVRIVPDTDRTNDNAPSHRIYVGRAEIGAASSKRSSEGRDYLSVKLDDPSFDAPIYANLFDDEDAETFTLIWSRSRKANGD